MSDYCVNLSYAEFAVLLSSNNIDEFYGFDIDAESIDRKKYIQAVFTLVERGLIDVETDGLSFVSELKRIIQCIKDPKKTFAVESILDPGMNQCLYIENDNYCVQMLKTENDRIIISETALELWIDRLDTDYIPQRLHNPSVAPSDGMPQSLLYTLSSYTKNLKPFLSVTDCVISCEMYSFVLDERYTYSADKLRELIRLELNGI